MATPLQRVKYFGQLENEALQELRGRLINLLGYLERAGHEAGAAENSGTTLPTTTTIANNVVRRITDILANSSDYQNKLNHLLTATEVLRNEPGRTNADKLVIDKDILTATEMKRREAIAQEQFEEIIDEWNALLETIRLADAPRIVSGSPNIFNAALQRVRTLEMTLNTENWADKNVDKARESIANMKTILAAREQLKNAAATAPLVQRLSSTGMYLHLKTMLAAIESIHRKRKDDRSTNLPTCRTCSGLAARACARCKTAHYCSPECQRANWSRHKTECAPKPGTSGRRKNKKSRKTLRRRRV